MSDAAARCVGKGSSPHGHRCARLRAPADHFLHARSTVSSGRLALGPSSRTLMAASSGHVRCPLQACGLNGVYDTNCLLGPLLRRGDRIDRAASRLIAGASAQDAVAAAMSGDSSMQTRQYGVALAHGEANFRELRLGGRSQRSIRLPRGIFWWDRRLSALRWKRFKRRNSRARSCLMGFAIEAGSMQGGDNRCPGAPDGGYWRSGLR